MSRRWEPLLEQVARERYGRLVARAMLYERSRADAEDLVQDALVSTFSARGSFTSVEQAEAYVRRAIATRFLDRARRRTVERRVLATVAARREQPDEIELGLSADLRAALATLQPRQRACVVLRHLEDLSTRETAQALDLSEGAVKRYLSEGVRALNALLSLDLPVEPDVDGLARTEVRND
jgi:RNA polymerase sigma factor (sigma-70 family)